MKLLKWNVLFVFYCCVRPCWCHALIWYATRVFKDGKINKHQGKVFYRLIYYFNIRNSECSQYSKYKEFSQHLNIYMYTGQVGQRSWKTWKAWKPEKLFLILSYSIFKLSKESYARNIFTFSEFKCPFCQTVYEREKVSKKKYLII